jgi:hypothetical protein
VKFKRITPKLDPGTTAPLLISVKAKTAASRTKSKQIVTLDALQSANDIVLAELETLGFWDESLDAIEVFLVPLGVALGWQRYGGDQSICIPAVSFGRLLTLFGWEPSDLTDVVRHEYGHAVADTHRGLFRSRRFSSVFGGSHESERGTNYDPEQHVTTYAATKPSEDFAELFCLYLRHKGQLPRCYNKSRIRAKWQFIRDLSRAIRQGRRRW